MSLLKTKATGHWKLGGLGRADLPVRKLRVSPRDALLHLSAPFILCNSFLQPVWATPEASTCTSIPFATSHTPGIAVRQVAHTCWYHLI